MRVGLVADTHVGEWIPELPDAVGAALAGVDLILHAGDITDLAVLDRLGAVAPVIAVQGDHDRDAGIVLPRSRVVEVAGVRIGLTHGRRWKPVEFLAGVCSVIVHRPVLLGLHRALRRRFADVDVIVYGHLHLAETRWRRGVLFVNPGAVHNVERAAGYAAAGVSARRYLAFRTRLPRDAAAPSVAVLEIAPSRMTVLRLPLVEASPEAV